MPPARSPSSDDSGVQSGARSRSSSDSSGTGTKTEKYYPKKRPRILVMSESEESSSSGEKEYSEDSYCESLSSDDEPLFKRLKLKIKVSTKKIVGDMRKKGRPSKRKMMRNSRKSKRKFEDLDGDEENGVYSVERIDDMKVEDGKRYFFVKWLNYDSSENTWEPEEHLDNCADVMKEFFEGIGRNHADCPQSGEGESEGSCNGTESGTSSVPKRLKLETIQTKASAVTKNETVSQPTFWNRSPLKEQQKKRTESDSSTFLKRSDDQSKSEKRLTEEEILKASKNMISATKIDVDDDARSTPPLLVPQSQSPLESDEDSMDDVLNPILKFAMQPIKGSLPVYKFRVMSSGKMDYLRIDLNESPPSIDLDEGYECVITEDLEGKQLHYFFGATQAADGEIFCLVHFEGFDHVDIVPHNILFKKFRFAQGFFEVHCPNLFPKSTSFT